MNLNTQIRLLQLVNHLIAIPTIIYLFTTGQATWLWVSLAIWIFVGPISAVVTLHRLLTHRSFKTYPWIEKLLCIITVYSTVGPTISWVALHRMHHAKSDKEGDPHSPYENDKFTLKKALQVWAGYDWKIDNIPVKYVKDLMREPIHRFIFAHYFKIIFITGIVLLLINPMLFLCLYVIPSVMTFHIIGMVNVLGHYHGYRNYETNDHSTNSWIANLFSLGEGWHNNHHAKPNGWHAGGEHWWEWDLMAQFIRLIRVK